MKQILNLLFIIIGLSAIAQNDWDTATSGKITYSGNVGIGTTSPGAPLHIKGSGMGSHLSIETDSNGHGDLQWFQGGASAINQRAALQVDHDNGDFEGWVYNGSGWIQWLQVDRGNGNISTQQKVGIGTSTPTYDLEISPTSHRPTILLNSRGTGNNLNTDIYFADNGSTRWSLAHRPYDQNNDFVVWRKNGSWTQALSINYASGRIGIGTNAPSKLLDVHGDARIGKLDARHYLKISSAHWPEVRFESPTSSEQIRLGLAHTDASSYGVETGDMYVYTQTVNQMPFIVRKNGDLRFNIKGGNVGIGTTTTGSHRLAVEGSIGAREVKVEASGWSDFVFEKDYDLPSIEEVEKFIKSNKHLPDIPSEEDVKENGINLGEMDAKLLQKIEELTLYTIQQQKEIEQLKKENESLKSDVLKRIEKLENE